MNPSDNIYIIATAQIAHDKALSSGTLQRLIEHYPGHKSTASIMGVYVTCVKCSLYRSLMGSALCSRFCMAQE
jgi:hypothetical protein